MIVKKFVKQIGARTFINAIKKMEEAQSLGFMVEMIQISQEPLLLSCFSQDNYLIKIYEPVKETQEREVVK
ncbi:hypothetical protein [Bacillus safensis]|uniref:hypothetical protein n=1 Tax=Bacillus safensis TaxID=561879 RepID=UPI002281E511|nr:hypothetical protein [Bacillus safensis]MCY7675726.1 hypothetical protein [Bacillus safensis]MCY7699781.1 hypothetical protein [Bacillus safensis]MEC3628329.1 hypothetical protein [Bacillus safensis]